MDFLTYYGFSESDIQKLKRDYDPKYYRLLVQSSYAIEENLRTCQWYGIEHLNELFLLQPAFFIQEPSHFKSILTKYPKDALGVLLQEEPQLLGGLE